jgi:FkbM family methyltransferase
MKMTNMPPTFPSVAFEGLLSLREHIAKNRDDQEALFVTLCAANLMRSPAQLYQDLFVLFMLQHKRNGFFVEFGATNGISLSNSYALEKNFGWQGIVAEPARCWHEELRKNRSSAIDTRCVWGKSGHQLDFTETTSPELSTINAFIEGDLHSSHRHGNATYAVDTVSLNDLLITHNAPAAIDYLSIDTEGSEYEILKAFDFTKHAIDIITVEHNWREPETGEIDRLLTQNGYVKMFERLSKWDGWYVHRRVLETTGQ